MTHYEPVIMLLPHVKCESTILPTRSSEMIAMQFQLALNVTVVPGDPISGNIFISKYVIILFIVNNISVWNVNFTYRQVLFFYYDNVLN